MDKKRLFAYSHQLPLLLLVLLNLTEARSSSKETRRRSLIMPGTKWCGAGDVATEHDELGQLKDLDLCCRNHDDCPQSIDAGETKYGYVNNRQYTFSSCDCDKRFRECLQKVGDNASKVVANLYSLTFKNKCINLEKKCTETSESGECTQYSDEETAVESELPEPEEEE